VALPFFLKCPLSFRKKIVAIPAYTHWVSWEKKEKKEHIFTGLGPLFW